MNRIIPLTRGKSALVDDLDYEYLYRFSWECTYYGYAARHIYVDGKSMCIYMHREIIGAKAGQQVDHRNMNKLDNRRSNLRITDRQGNARNTAKPKLKRGATSSYKGVCLNKDTDKWQAGICVDGNTRHLGLYGKEEDAALAYDERARVLFRDYARLNFPEVSDYSNLPKRKTSSRFRGVSWIKKEARWYASIQAKGKSVNLGKYDDEAQAAHAYDVAARQLHGNRAVLNFPWEDTFGSTRI